MGLVTHAKQEMELAGLYDKGADYDGMIPEAVMEIVEVFAKQGHSGYSASIVRSILSKVLAYDTLTPVNSDPQYWMKVSDEHAHTKACWQSTRDPSYFSEDGGKTFYWLDDPEKKNWPKRFNK